MSPQQVRGADTGCAGPMAQHDLTCGNYLVIIRQSPYRPGDKVGLVSSRLICSLAQICHLIISGTRSYRCKRRVVHVLSWRQLTRINPTTNGGRQRLKRLREKHRPFLKLTEDVAVEQMAGGNDFVLEQPLQYDGRHQLPIQHLEQLDEVYGVVGNCSSFSFHRSVKLLPVNTSTWRLTTSPDIAIELSEQLWPEQLAGAILCGFRKMLVRKDRGRLRSLCASLDSRVRGLGVRAPEEMVEQLAWLRAHPRLWEGAGSARPCADLRDYRRGAVNSAGWY